MVTETKTAINTQEAVNKFIEDCRYRGLAQGTIETRARQLRHFVLEYPELPTEWGPIDRFLTRVIKKKSARYDIRKTLLALYKYLGQQNVCQNPIPPGKVGRPKKADKNLNKLGMGGQTFHSERKSTSLSTCQAIEDFFDSEDLTEASIACYRTYLNKLTKAFPGELPTTPGPLERHIKSIVGSPEHRHGSFRVIRALYNFLEKRHRLPVDPQWGVQNPVKQINAPRVPKKLPASLNADELIRLFAATENDKERALVLLSADCGLRGGEIASLQVENIDEELLRVKGKTGERQVSISPEVRDTLLAFAPKKGYIFTDSFGQPATVDSLYNLVKKLLKRAGIEKRHMGTHLLRHTFGRNSLVLGADLVTVQKQMGHSSILTTRKYTELAQEEVHKIHQGSSPARQLLLGFNGNNHSETNQ